MIIQGLKIIPSQVPAQPPTIIVDFSSTIELLTEYFVGRKDAINEINTFIKNNISGYFTIIAEPGIGKSALMAFIAKKYKYPHHFISKRD